MGQISVLPAPPPRIARLVELAYNLWWSWQPAAQALYRDIDPALWTQVNHNPVRLLRRARQADLERVAADAAYVARYDAVLADFDAYMQPAGGSTWYAQRYGADGALIAYFSAEFGLHESLPIYSGGLGILSGDHCKGASDLGLPLVGVGFLYPQGYFEQQINGEGRQEAIYEKLDFSEVPATPALDGQGRQVVVNVELPGRTVHAKVWRFQVGRISIYLMDTDVEQNQPGDRELSARLYGGDQQMRISQEVILGIGGVRVLRALGLQPTVWHMNEGHAAFLQLERIREYVQGGLPFEAALWAARSDALFTTHTPVPAGNDAFPFDLMDRFFGAFWGQMGLNRDRFLDLGRFDYPWGALFSMTVLALRASSRANGVSKLHGAVSRRMWRGLWPEAPLAEIPIGYVTNGVHTDTWLHPGLAALLDRYLAHGWRHTLDDRRTWAAVARIRDAELWAQHNAAKREMLALVRERVAAQLLRIGAGPAEINAAIALDPDALTVGFARRFATYKRATLLFRDRDRLLRILNAAGRPVQLIFSGKAHPADEPGKSFIQAIYQFSRQPEFRGKIVFVEDYDANIARSLVAGADLWLNNPRRPLEASGTSGQKAGLNGIPNFSVLDGWWSESYDGRNGWAIGAEREYPNEAAQDEADMLSLYATLESEIVPLYYARGVDGLPHGWLERMKAAISTVGPDYSMMRMLGDYVARFYTPAGQNGRRLRANDFAAAHSLAGWVERVLPGWQQVALSASGPQQGQVSVGQPIRIEATLRPAALRAEDVTVELVYGHRQGDDLVDATVVPLRLARRAGDTFYYETALVAAESGDFAYGVRVRPDHPDLPSPFALGMVKWALPA